MNPYHRLHRRFLAKRQDLPGGVIGGLIPVSSTTAQDASSTGSQSTNPGGIIGGLTSVVGGVTTDILPSSAHSSTSSTPLTHSSSSTGSTTSSHSTTSTSSTTFSTSPSLTTHAGTPTLTPSTPVVFTSSDGTSIVYVTSTPPAASATTAPHPSFLQNPSLEGGVFALVGIIALIVIFVLITWTIRKRRRDRLEKEFAAAVSFDPGATNLYEHQGEMMEKQRLSGSSSGHGYGPGYAMPQMAFAPQQEYHPQGYGQHPAVAYCPPPPNQFPYPTPSPAISQPAGQGGANLTRKFSDRKPVPPLLPPTAHDPATHVSIPPQVYQQ